MEPGSDRRLSRRCTLVTAAAGYGKTTAVRDRLRGAAVRWHDESLLRQAGPVLVPAGEPLWLVTDEVSRLDIDRVVEFADGLPAECRLVVIGRVPVQGRLARWRARGLLAELGPGDLALTRSQVEALLRHEYRVGEADLVWAWTAGWPALVHLAGQALARPDRPASPQALLGWMTASDTPIADFFESEVLEGLAPEVLGLLADAAYLDPVTADLAAWLGHQPSEVDMLYRIGLLRAAAEPGSYRMPPLLAKYLRTRSGGTGQDLLARAASWYADHDLPLAAVEAYCAAGLTGEAMDLVCARGDSILAAGGATAVIKVAERVPARHRPPVLKVVHAQALYTTGESAAALRMVAEFAGDDGHGVDPALAWRAASLHYLSGDPRTALSILDRAHLDGDPADLARLHSWAATVHWLLGNMPACAHAAEQAMSHALSAGAPDAMAAAYVAKALHAKLAGDPEGNGEHYDRALTHAERARDVVQVTRIRSNRASRLIDDARFAEALSEVQPGARLAEAIGHLPMQALALVNEGEALAGLGRLDEALAAFERSVWLYRRTGSQMVAYPLLGVAGIQRRRGRRVEAETAYEEVIRIAEAADDRQALVPALAGLTKVVAAHDTQAALRHAERALAVEPDSTVATLALGWAKLATAEVDRAAELAAQAARRARQLRERALLPEALELMGSAAQSPALARKAWREALALWQAADAQLDADRVAATLGVLPGASADDRIAAKLAESRLAARGVDWTPAGAPPYRVLVRTFGRFEVSTGSGDIVVWQSRKARDLLRILVARRGRPVPREELGEMLWPDENPAKVAHRLSVALSTVRGALDAGRRMPADHFLQSGQGSVALDTVRIDIDLEDFLLAVEHGLRLVREGETEQARLVLRDAQRLYTGDFLGDEPYDDWAIPAREEARATYLRVLRTLVDLAQECGDTADAVTHLHQILQLDAYDENAHLALIDLLTRYGWHGEARRAQARYRQAMGELPPVSALSR
ncbi:BTAD domain-containing putative transcriptional regulator [Allorhizocola rhizosphaerae]|uniref:BTAD domain-containing putative transcriptional regulator n=1 Tax=Allorhizocola rhizosphaerae TaxID=1872709 RepID=UPI000E3C2FF2|nr:BTAD domain-containing putative transcriptional regulator [Allorhizocola rhizosphaerae]